MTPEKFVATYLQAARDATAQTGISAVFALAQAALESGWGAKAPGNNLFGIRADASWHGPVVDITTHEVVGGISQLQHGQGFRAYLNPVDSFVDWGRFLLGNPRYRPALIVKADPKLFARAVAKAGYSTDPHYGDTLCAMIDSINRRISA